MSVTLVDIGGEVTGARSRNRGGVRPTARLRAPPGNTVARSRAFAPQTGKTRADVRVCALLD
jgi:hypothetical protein